MQQRRRTVTERLAQPLARLLLVLMIGLFNPPVWAQSADSEQKAAQIARQQSGGDSRVLGVSKETTATGQTVYAVKIISQGRVRVIRINHQ